MATDCSTLSIPDLEELFEIPCGGNYYPRKRPCPANAPAVLVSVHMCPNGGPELFKCLDCWTTWFTAVGAGAVCCTYCKEFVNPVGLYRPI